MNNYMKRLGKHLEKLRGISKREHHPLIHKIHKKYNISKKTLFYVKEYGPHTNVPRTIIRESVGVLIFCAIVSSAGGLALENIKTLFVTLIPLIILLPTLNDMIGDYGCIVSARFSTMLHEGQVKRKWWVDADIIKLFTQVFIVAMITTLISSTVAIIISFFSHYAITPLTVLKIFAIALIDVAILVVVLFFTSVLGGLYFFKKKEDPNNFLMPIMTSIADFGNMIIIALLVILLF